MAASVLDRASDAPDPDARLGSLLDTDVEVETPEHIVFRYRLAGPFRRFCALLLDLLLCYTVLALIAAVVWVATVGGSSLFGATESFLGVGGGILLVLLFAAQWLYFAVLEGWRGTTPGKAALHLRVVTTTGRPIGLRAAALRNVLRAADALPLEYSAGLFSLAAFTSMVSTRRFQRLGDLVAETMVVAVERPEPAPPVLLDPPAQPSEIAGLPSQLTLDADERNAIDMFLRRRVRLGPARARELATMLLPVFTGRAGGLGGDPRWPSDPVRALALLHEAASAGRSEAPVSAGTPDVWR